MSINQYEFSHSQDTQEYAWWTQKYNIMDSTARSSNSPFQFSTQKAEPAAADHTGAVFCFNLNNEEEKSAAETAGTGPPPEGETEPGIASLFEKPLTPSDVGKLNRLVIPKQHAEKYFPMNGAADSCENALLLGFEDEAGKSWQFRYSYWNSSQSYVLTKGWSRFVKEKRLDAGDVVVFSRHRDDAGRLFIGWRRRNSNQTAAAGSWNRAFYSTHPCPTKNPSPTTGSSVSQQKQNQPLLQTPNGNSKRLLRLFGVNLECQGDDDSEPSTPICSMYHQYYPNHMDMISFSGGGGGGGGGGGTVTRDMLYRQG